MKVFAICAVVCGGVFLLGMLQLGVLKTGFGRSSAASEGADSEKKAPAKAKFPDELAPAARAKAVAKAAPFKAGSTPHKLVVMTPTGELHSWHESLPDDWQADTVEETELVVVVAKQKRTLLSHVPRVLIGTNTPAPPMDRVRYDVEVSVVEAKTGIVVDNRVFRNEPRQYRSPEPYATTTIGRTVEWGTIYRWVSQKCKTGFPDENDTEPNITIID
jgi:hypothetical protein